MEGILEKMEQAFASSYAKNELMAKSGVGVADSMDAASLDATLAPTNGLFVATRIKPQARVFAESRGVECIEVDLERLRGDAPPDLRLF